MSDEFPKQLNPPGDYAVPDWNKFNKVHGWRNYVSLEIQDAWPTFPIRVRLMLAANFEDIASKEDWE